MSYCTDAQILEVDPQAENYLPKGESDFERIREIIEERIDDNLRRRSTPILPSDLSDPSELKNCEVYGVLAELLFKSASKPGKDDADWYTQEAIRYQDMFTSEVNAPLSTKGDTVTRVGSIRMRRC